MGVRGLGEAISRESACYTSLTAQSRCSEASLKQCGPLFGARESEAGGMYDMCGA
jgi:hypothetical protein